MTQEDIMNFLDEHEGVKFSYLEIRERFSGVMNVQSVCHALSRIIRREEYSCEVIRMNNHYMALYWKKKEEEIIKI